MKQIKITGENRKAKLKELLSHFYTGDLDRYTEAQLIEMYDALGYYKISKNNFDIICMRREPVKEDDMWTKQQSEDLDRRFEKHKNELKNEIIEIMDKRFAEQDAKIDQLRNETNAKFDKLFKHLGIE